MSDSRIKIMVGVATEQNSTNILPALQLKINHFISLETSGAARANWSSGLEELLADRNVGFEKLVLLPAEDSRIDIIISKIREMLKEYSNFEVIWNLGGGQKPQQLAMWQCFLTSQLVNVIQSACYTNPVKHEIELWSLAENNLTYKTIQLKNELPAEDLLKLYGFKTSGSRQIYSKWNKDNKPVNEKLWEDKKFREFSFRVPAVKEDEDMQLDNLVRKVSFELLEREKKELAKTIEKTVKGLKPSIDTMLNANPLQAGNSILKAIRKKEEEILRSSLPFKRMKTQSSKVFNNLSRDYFDGNDIILSYDAFKQMTGRANPARYFEFVLECRIQSVLEKDNHHILYAYSNVEVYTNDSKVLVAEYDILLVTEWGTLIALDAKTFEFERKDANARLFNLQQAGGRYVQFIPVIPFDPDDCSEEYFPDKLKRLPVFCKNQKMKLFIITAKPKYEKFTLTNETLPIKEDETIELIPLELLLESLGLLAK
ncbi:MAG: hypothetical protein AMXMBFR48_14450 [Ignavibacteriales bacterium]